MGIITSTGAPTPLVEVSNGGTFFIETRDEIIKKPKTFDELLKILKSKNIIITNDTSTKAFLNRVNYYRFSGYFLPFQVNGHGPLFSNVEIERLIAIYEFDEQLRNLIARAVDVIEIYLRTQLYMLKLMYPDCIKWNNEVCKPLIKLVNKYKPYISMKHLDFPYRWKSMLRYK